MRRLGPVARRLRTRTAMLALVAAFFAAAAVAWSITHAGATAQGEVPGPPNDLLALGQGTGQTPARAAVQRNPEPPLQATPRAVCGPGSNPLNGMQGRVPAAALKSPRAAHGYTCNLTVVGHQGSSGGFKVLRYIDQQGHECAFYDTALLFPINAVRLFGPSLGVAVLDMSNPSHPVQTATLTQPPMLSPHESLSLNPRRGLIAAVLGNPNTQPGLVSIYDASRDCRHPVLDSTALVARFGHEGNFSADGNTFYAAGTSVKSVTAIDVSDPKHPHAIWQGNEYSHGLTLSDDGGRAYVADPINGQLLILDTSEIQARRPDPQVREISRLTWGPVTIPQNAIPMTIHGHPYLLEFDEYAFRFNSPSPPDTVGAARIIDISDERHPRVVSNLRLEVNQPAGHHAAVAAGDPGTLDPAQGYAAHYCNIPRQVDPEIVACSFITSGLRIFNISDPLHPHEVAYFIAPPKAQPENGYNGSNFAMSKPAFAPERREVWYSDGGTGFYDLRLDNSVWPDPTGLPSSYCPAPRGRVRGNHFGPVSLGQRRARVQAALRGSATAHRRRRDEFCLAGGDIRAIYAGGRVALVASTNRHYSVGGRRPGERARIAVRKAHVLERIRIAHRTWLVLGGRRSHGILELSRRRVVAVGIASKRLTARRSRSRGLLARAR